MLPTRKNPHLSHYDYSQNGCYFITLCTEKRKMLLGSISAGQLELSFLGGTADNELSVLDRFFEDIAIPEKIIMPNHIHFIVQIQQTGNHSPLSVGRFGKGANITTDVLLKICEALHCRVEDIIETIND